MKDNEGMANSVDPDREQSDLVLYYLPRPVCPNTENDYSNHMLPYCFKVSSARYMLKY